MFSPEVENLIAYLARQLAPADRDAFRHDAESALGTPQCWGPGLIHRTVVAVWRGYFHPPTDRHIAAWERTQRPASKRRLVG
jgi:hypothetical protein